MIMGTEIEDSAMPLMAYDAATGVCHFPFVGNTAFVFGNEVRLSDDDDGESL